MVASQLLVEQWYELIPDPTVADAIMDRLINRPHNVALVLLPYAKEKTVSCTLRYLRHLFRTLCSVSIIVHEFSRNSILRPRNKAENS